MSVARAEAMALFKEHRHVSLQEVRKTVRKAGFQYRSAEIVALGELDRADQGAHSDLLLRDSRAEMTLRLAASDTESIIEELKTGFRRGTLGDTVQVRGIVREPHDGQDEPDSSGPPVIVEITSWSAGSSAELPSLVPPGSKQRKSPQEHSSGGWF